MNSRTIYSKVKGERRGEDGEIQDTKLNKRRPGGGTCPLKGSGRPKNRKSSEGTFH